MKASLRERIRGYYLGKIDDVNYQDPMILYYAHRRFDKNKKSLKLSDVAKYKVKITDEEFESLGVKRRY